MSDTLDPALDDAKGVRPEPRVQSVARAIAILTHVAASADGLRAMEIARACKLGRQGAYHMLHTLTEYGMLARNAEGRYVVGVRLAGMGEAFLRQSAPSDFLGPLVRRAAIETGEAAYAAGWVGHEIANLVSAAGANPIQASAVPVGYHGFAHARAAGKLLLAYAADDLRERYLQKHMLARRTPNTLCDAKVLRRELAEVRERGYAVDREEFAAGLCCLAVPAIPFSAKYALSISAPAHRFSARFDDYLRQLGDICGAS
jgi:IclR family acetate operon transcriptional repressor